MLREVEALLERGRAIGSKPLKEYLEVKGYGDAAKWVYAQTREPGDWSNEELITVQTVRHVHFLTMNPVWQVAPTLTPPIGRRPAVGASMTSMPSMEA